MEMFFISLLLFFEVSFGQERCTTPNGAQGTCVSMKSCPALLQFYNLIRSGDIPESSASFISNSICGNQKLALKVCCKTKKDVTFVIQGTAPSGTGAVRPVLAPVEPLPPANLTNLSGFHLLESPATCGKKGILNRVVGGKNAKLGSWPWMVVFRIVDQLGSARWACGGTLISRRYVLSAAHCFAKSKITFARIGELSLQSDPDCDASWSVCAPAPQDIPIEQVLLYPSYDMAKCLACDDIALVRLARPAQLYRKFVIPICLPLSPKEQMGYSPEEFVGLDAMIAGWGSVNKDSNNRNAADNLQQAHIRIVDLPYCATLKSRLPNKATAFCAGEGNGIDSCSGDSGGPLTLVNKGNTQTFLAGITSYGPEVCGVRDTQGLYTSVLHYVPWIVRSLRP